MVMGTVMVIVMGMVMGMVMGTGMVIVMGMGCGWGRGKGMVSSAYESARTILVLVAFSIVNFVFPPCPATRPIARDKCSPFSVFTGIVITKKDEL